MTELARIDMPPPDNAMALMIERLVMDPNVPIDKLERMLAMQERIVAEGARAAFSAAFAAASAQFPNIPLNGRGDKNKAYALLKDIMGLTRPVLSRHGLALSFAVNSEGATVKVTAELMHVAGHSKTTSIDLPKDQSGSKNAVQAVGSSQTYGQRYTAQAILGLSLGEDTEDDGKAAGAGSTISADEFFELRNLIDSTGADEAKFCEYLKVPNIEMLPKAMFAQAVSALRKKLKAKDAA